MTRAIPEPVLDLLREARIEDNVLLKMPSVDRATYDAFDEVLRRLRGKWYRGKGHKFPYDPTAAIAAVIGLAGESVDFIVMDDLADAADAFMEEHAATPAQVKVVLDSITVDSGVMPAKNPLAYFPTPAPVAREVVSLLSWWPHGTRVLEPSAGSGALVQAALEKWPGANVMAVEADPLNVAALAARSWARPDWSAPDYEIEPEIIAGDFMEIEPAEVAGLVLMNPPFAVKGDSMAWETHLRRAWRWLVPGGRLACIAPGNVWQGRGTKRAKAAREWLREIGAKVYDLDPKSFAESGTGVATCVIIAKKLTEADLSTPWGGGGYPSAAAFYTWLVVDGTDAWAARRDKLSHLAADDPKVEKFLREAAIHANEHEGEIPITDRTIAQLKQNWPPEKD